MKILSPYSIEYILPTSHRPIIMMLNPDTFEWNQIMLTDHQLADISNAIFDILAVNDEVELTVEDDLYIVHKKNKPIKQYYNPDEIKKSTNI
jgi:hypothetical protein